MSQEQHAIREGIIHEIRQERSHQIAKWGDRSWGHFDVSQLGGSNAHLLPDLGSARRTVEDEVRGDRLTWTSIAVEELCEAVDAALNQDIPALRGELVQLAAVVLAWIEDLDRRRSKP